jgi:hypothetical protein
MAIKEDLRRADRVARRLHGELAAFIAALPRERRNASALARHLGIDRTTCQRAVFVAARPYAGIDVFSRLPGVRGLQQLTEAAVRTGIDESSITGLVTAVEQLEVLLRSFGGSQSRLVRELLDADQAAVMAPAGATPDPTAAEEEPGGVTARRTLFEAAAEVTGRSSQCWVAIYIYRPLPEHPGRLELIRANGLAGHMARADAVPLVMHNFTTRSPAEGTGDPAAIDGRFLALDGSPLRPRALDSILEEFTSTPLPLVSTKQPNEFLVQSFDEPEASIRRPVDIMMATRITMADPARRSPPVEEAWALVNFPCRHLVFDIYLDREIARACIPSLDAHLWRPDFAQHVGDRWQTRFADGPMLQVLRPASRVPPTVGYRRLPELTRAVFTRAGLAAEEYVGYRCEVTYPIWRAGYCVSLDFTPPSGEDVHAADGDV